MAVAQKIPDIPDTQKNEVWQVWKNEDPKPAVFRAGGFSLTHNMDIYQYTFATHSQHYIFSSTKDILEIFLGCLPKGSQVFIFEHGCREQGPCSAFGFQWDRSMARTSGFLALGKGGLANEVLERKVTLRV